MWCRCWAGAIIEKQLSKGERSAVVNRLMISCRQPLWWDDDDDDDDDDGNDDDDGGNDDDDDGDVDDILQAPSFEWTEEDGDDEMMMVAMMMMMMQKFNRFRDENVEIHFTALCDLRSCLDFCDSWVSFGAKCPFHNLTFWRGTMIMTYEYDHD